MKKRKTSYRTNAKRASRRPIKIKNKKENGERFPHPPTTPEGSVPGSRRPGIPRPAPHPRGCSKTGGEKQNTKSKKNKRSRRSTYTSSTKYYSSAVCTSAFTAPKTQQRRQTASKGKRKKRERKKSKVRL